VIPPPPTRPSTTADRRDESLSNIRDLDEESARPKARRDARDYMSKRGPRGRPHLQTLAWL
jgi:hypothetical protein